MGEVLPSFTTANLLPAAPPREQELESLCNLQAARIEQLEDLLDRQPIKSQGAAPPAAGLKPEERQALLQILSDLREATKEQAKEIERLKKESLEQAEQIALLRDGLVRMRKDSEHIEENQAIQASILAKLKHKPPGKTDMHRVQKLIQYMQARPDKKASFEALKGHFQVKDNQLNAMIRSANELDPGRFEARKDDHDGRRRWLIIKR